MLRFPMWRSRRLRKERTRRSLTLPVGADKPTQLLPALNMAGSELNALAFANVPVSNARFAIVFHGPAVDGILDNEHYKAKFGLDNPNLRVIAEMKKAGVEFFVCWQYLAGEKIDPKL